ncbi:hypothetical protein [Sphingomonas sp. ERG5]|uniref:hypothetical protein n=1 Tax=Sphingomonas sp. ERG5 TaxID=1381597 RepID=UPI000A91EA31|nr:hypothetical protein [Sphingomonas sp. ERG5]
MSLKTATALTALICMLPPAPANATGAQPGDAAGVVKTMGTLRLNLATGRVEGQVCVSNRPAEFAGAFALNAGLNVAKVTDGDGKPLAFHGWFNPGVSGEARIYTLSEAPPTLCVRYVGAYPVYPAHDAPDDFKGVMAFNGDSARFTEQSAWVPTPYDDKAKARGGNNAAYDLDIYCAGCRYLYMSGSPVIEGDHGKFSATARPDLFFGGTGPITRTANVTILNEAVPTAQADALSNMVGKIDAYYRGYMGQAVSVRPTFLRVVMINQVDRDRKGSEWGFAAWPTIGMSGSVGKIGQILLTGGDAVDNKTGYIAHEMGHYYFGTLAIPVEGPYYGFMWESTAEFLAQKALRAINGDAAADQRVAGWVAKVEKRKEPFAAFDRIADRSAIDDIYRYDYGPLLLLALEKQVGEAKMRAFMRGLLATPGLRSWAELQAVAGKAGIDDAAWESWRNRCVADGKRAC